MLRLAVSEFTTFRWSLEEDLELYHAAGFEGIGVWQQKLTDCGEQEGIELVCQSDLDVSSLQWAGGFTGSDGRSHRESIDDGLEALELAACIQAECLVAYTGGRGGHTRGHSRRLATNAMREMAAYAEDLEITIGVEAMHSGCGSDWTFLNQLDDGLRFLDEVNSPFVKLIFDTYHWGNHPKILDRLPSMIDRLALVQLGDAVGEPRGEQDRLPLLSGSLPLQEIVLCLQESGYDGFYEVELMGPEIEILDYADLLAQSCSALHDMGSVTS